MKRKVLLNTEPCPVPKTDREYVIAASQIVQLEDMYYLNIDMFYEGRLQARYFADVYEHDWCVNINGKWQKLKLNNVARAILKKEILKNFYWACGVDWEFASQQDELRVLKYIDTYSINSFEESVTWEKNRNAVNRKLERIARLMDIVEPVPDRAEQWLDEEIFPEQYLFVTDGEKSRKYVCTKCGAHSWTKLEYKNYQKTTCPNCNTEVKVEKKSDKKFRYENVIILQLAGDKWVKRQFRVEAWWTHDGKAIKLNENIRAICDKGHTWGKLYYGTENKADEWQQEWWDKNSRSQHFQNSFLYPYNLAEVLPYAGLEHSGIDILANKNLKFCVNNAIYGYGSRPWLEYLIKTGLTALAVEVINGYRWSYININGKNLSTLLKIDGNRVSRMKQINGNMYTLEWLQYEEKTGIKVTQDAMEYLTKKKVRPSDCRLILQELKSVTRMVNYMKKQKVAPDKLVITWQDYLRMAQEEGYDVTDDIVRLPKDLKARHDDLVDIRNERQDEERLAQNAEKYRKLDNKILKRMPEIKKYFYEDDNYMIVPAGTCEELMKEGRALHHCVGASDIYMSRMAEGTSWILFMRKKSNLEKPYYTIEISMDNDSIIQAYSEYDRKPDWDEVDKVLESFRKNIKKLEIA